MAPDARAIVVGAGQAGLAVSCRLSEEGVEHVVLVHFLRKRKSSPLIGVGEDAAIVARRIGRA